MTSADDRSSALERLSMALAATEYATEDAGAYVALAELKAAAATAATTTTTTTTTSEK